MICYHWHQHCNDKDGDCLVIVEKDELCNQGLSFLFTQLWQLGFQFFLSTKLWWVSPRPTKPTCYKSNSFLYFFRTCLFYDQFHHGFVLAVKLLNWLSIVKLGFKFLVTFIIIYHYHYHWHFNIAGRKIMTPKLGQH